MYVYVTINRQLSIDYQPIYLLVLIPNNVIIFSAWFYTSISNVLKA